MSSDVGQIVTAEGRIEPDELGVCLPHEHSIVDLAGGWYHPPDSARDRALAESEITLNTLRYVRRNPQQHQSNFRLGDVGEAIDELSRFHRAGGDSFVELTPKGTGGDPALVRGIGRATGLHVVHGTAYYVRSAHPPGLEDRSIDDIAAEFERDVRAGIDGGTVRAGLVGEIGVSGHVHEVEERVLRAAARAARRTGACLNVHPPGRTEHAQRDRSYPPSRWGLELVDVIEEEGLPADRVVMSHMDRTIHMDTDYQRQLADRGTYLEYDLWGTELYLESHNDSYPSDPQRADAVVDLIDDGYADRLLFSHDVCMKVQRVAYGGYGYAHLMENVLPMLRYRGVDGGTLDTITVDNPARVLAFVEPEE